MQWLAWGKLLRLTGVSLVVSLTAPIQAQTPTPSTYESGCWQHMARINPQRPITVILLNQTNSLVKYNFLNGHADDTLPVMASIRLKNISLPSNINIYNPSSQAAAGKDNGLTYETAVVNGNDLKVIIEPPNATSGFHVINISKSGGVYIY